MLILDTDHISILQQRTQPDFDNLQVRLSRVIASDTATTIVSFQEQVEGWLAYLHRARKPAGILRAYFEMKRVLQYFCDSSVLPFSQEAQERFEGLRQERVRIPTMDLRIASIALTAEATLLSRNLRDFRQVPGLLVEDWTR